MSTDDQSLFKLSQLTHIYLTVCSNQNTKKIFILQFGECITYLLFSIAFSKTYITLQDKQTRIYG